MKSLLVVSVTGMGDSLWATPAIRALKKTFPEVEINLLTNKLWVSLFENNVYLNRIFSYQPEWYQQWKTIFNLRGCKFDHMLVLHANKNFVRIQKYIDYKQVWGIQNFPWIPASHQVLNDGQVHAIQKRLRLIEEIGGKPDDSYLDLFLGEEIKREGIRFLEKKGFASNEYVYVNVGASSANKRWPDKRFSGIIERLLDETPFNVVVGVGPKEGDWVDFLVKKFNTKRVISTRKLPISIVAFIIGQSRLTITSDTGPMHLAFAQHVPTVALFGVTHPDYCGPPNPKSENCFLILSQEYQGHLEFPQKNHPNAFFAITEEMVWEKVIQAFDYAEKNISKK
jgi:ADP-heptose:LPS heptosyltransferase